jgi:diacylglycerol O-acyltransferase / wax synthase
MSSHSLNPLDASWLYVESRETPMHVAGLIYFQLPSGAGRDYLQKMLQDFRKFKVATSPWNRRLASSNLKSPLHRWEETDDVDLEHHVRHSALPWPGGERELGQLIARLHSQPLDFSRPPWECHFIEGLTGDRFALYTKIHHSLIDGVSGVKLLLRSLHNDPEKSAKLPPFWAAKAVPPARQEKEATKEPTVARAGSGLLGALRQQIGTVPELSRAFSDMFKAATAQEQTLKAPFDTPISVFNGRIRGQRRVATQQFSLPRLKLLAKAVDATVNDIVLALCGTAIRRFLIDENALPTKPLTAGIPVSVRPADDDGHGNAITFIMATLGTDIADPVERIETIKASTRSAKDHVQRLPRNAMTQYTMLLMAPNILSLLTGLGGRTRPTFNLTISNVPGPTEPLYFRGARMEATYPVSLITHGQALNITCQSYADTLNFAFVGCRDTIPHMQRLAVYTGEALDQLESAVANQGKSTGEKAVEVASKRARRMVKAVRSAVENVVASAQSTGTMAAKTALGAAATVAKATADGMRNTLKNVESAITVSDAEKPADVKKAKASVRKVSEAKAAKVAKVVKVAKTETAAVGKAATTKVTRSKGKKAQV